MKEFLEIKNLGPIKEIHIDELKSLSVFIGESGSGKSTLMKALALFRWLFKMHNIQSYLQRSNSKLPFTLKMEHEYLENCGFDEIMKNNTEITYKVSMPSGKIYELRYANKKLSGVNKKELVEQDDLYFNKISFISETRNIISLWADKGARFAKSGDLGFYFHEVYNDFEFATDAIKELPLEFLSVDFLVKKTNFGKKYFIQPKSGDGYEIAYKNSSSGTQTSLPISLISQYFSQGYNFEEAFNRSVLRYLSTQDKLTDFKPVKNLSELEKVVYIHIEEPELSLYPDAQCSLINDTVRKCFVENKHNTNVCFSTHSPYIINHLNLLVRAYDKNKLIEGAKISFDELGVYLVSDGKCQDLKMLNHRLVNTNPLSETMDTIYDNYNNLE